MVGICVNQFPNLLIMFGPNSGAPWANLTTTFEIQAGYVVKHIKHIKRQVQKRKANYAMMVEAGVQKRYNEWIQSNMGPLAIVSPNCSNYYIVHLVLLSQCLPFQSSKGKPTFNWPFHGYYYRWCLRKIQYGDFVEIVGEAHPMQC
jgi:hypothetical protein